MTVAAHDHLCAGCGHHWDCLIVKCHVEQAVRVNKIGPWCAVCRPLIEAVRAARIRGLIPEAVVERLQTMWLL